MTPTAKLLLKTIETDGPFFAVGTHLARKLGVTAKTLVTARKQLVEQGRIVTYSGYDWAGSQLRDLEMCGLVYSVGKIEALEGKKFYVKEPHYIDRVTPPAHCSLNEQSWLWESARSGQYTEEATLDTGEEVTVLRYKKTDTTFMTINWI